MNQERLIQPPIDGELPNPPKIEEAIRSHEVDFLRKVWDTWSWQILPNGEKRNWLICQPTVIALSRILNWETGVPLLQDGDPNTQEHIKLSKFHIFDPPPMKKVVIMYFFLITLVLVA